MELILLKALALFRPILFVDTGVQLGGLNLFEIAAVAFTLILAAALAMQAATRKELNISATDLLIVAYVAWCAAIYLIYLDKAQTSVLAKFIIPPVTYLVAKNVIPSRQEYGRVLWLLLVGFAPPLYASVAVMAAGGGQEYVNYWTGVPRYEGVYAGPHEMSHSAAFMLMAAAVYVLLVRGRIIESTLGPARALFLAATALAALVCMYQSQVRTTVLGLLVFGGVLAISYFRRPSLAVIGALALGAMFVVSEDLRQRFFPEGIMATKSHEFDVTDLASGRPAIWSSQLKAFAALPVDRQIAGIGIGNSLANEASGDYLWLDAHNDFLRVALHTGIVGLLLYLALQVAIFRRVLRLEPSARHLLLAAFLAVMAMNVVSNSYVARFGMAQMFYLLMVFVEVRAPGAQPRAVGDPVVAGGGARIVAGWRDI